MAAPASPPAGGLLCTQNANPATPSYSQRIRSIHPLVNRGLARRGNDLTLLRLLRTQATPGRFHRLPERPLPPSRRCRPKAGGCCRGRGGYRGGDAGCRRGKIGCRPPHHALEARVSAPRPAGGLHATVAARPGPTLGASAAHPTEAAETTIRTSLARAPPIDLEARAPSRFPGSASLPVGRPCLRCRSVKPLGPDRHRFFRPSLRDLGQRHPMV
jgi:hypothetical protein